MGVKERRLLDGKREIDCHKKTKMKKKDKNKIDQKRKKNGKESTALMAYLPSSTRIFTSANIARVAIDGVGLHLLFHVVTRRLPFLKQEMPQRGVRAHT